MARLGADGYVDFARDRYKTIPGARHRRDTYPDRPYCDLCGPWRGRFLRKVGVPYVLDGVTMQDWRCESCDREG